MRAAKRPTEPTVDGSEASRDMDEQIAKNESLKSTYALAGQSSAKIFNCKARC